MAHDVVTLPRYEGEPLAGGFVTTVHRVGDTVRRPPPERADFVHALLGHLERQGWSGAPRYLGMDDRGREVLTYIAGHVPWSAGEPAKVSSPDTLRAVGRLIRVLHDLTAGTALAGDREVVCHNDLSPKNTVYGVRVRMRGLSPSTGISPRPASGSPMSRTPAGSTPSSGQVALTRRRGGSSGR